jgi:hypothetical protein
MAVCHAGNPDHLGNIVCVDISSCGGHDNHEFDCLCGAQPADCSTLPECSDINQLCTTNPGQGADCPACATLCGPSGSQVCCASQETCDNGVCCIPLAGTCNSSSECCNNANCCNGKCQTAPCCTPTTCQAEGFNCGTIDDGCGVELDCGDCTPPEVCENNVCVDKCANVQCPTPEECHDAGTCDPATGLCSDPSAKPDGTACDDGDACTQTDTCAGGVCIGGNPVVCTPSDQCHVAGTCDPATGLCSDPAKPDGTSCHDGNACTTDDVCTDGTCGGTPVACPVCQECGGGICQPVISDPDCATVCCSGICCPEGQQCINGVCSPCTDPRRPLFCKSRTGHGFKCCPRDSICDYSQPDGSVNCRKP